MSARRRLQLVLCTAAALACAVAVAEAPVRRSRLSVSENGLYAVRLVQVEKEACRLEVLRDEVPLWQLERCVGGVDDLYFVDGAGAKVWVVKTIPEKGKLTAAKGKKLKYPGWTYTEVAALFDRDGNKLASKQLHDFIKSRSGLSGVRELKRHFKWLEGVAGVPGKGPRLNEAGAVEFETIERKTFKLEF
jgi:hypothetical protein